MRVHFIAIGGAAMHNLALALKAKGYEVTGSDDEIFDPAKGRLEKAGLLPETMGWHAERITRDLDAVIVGMHATEDNPELKKATELGVKIYSFPEFLYQQTKDKIRVVVGGSHGKTTTTAMILYVLKAVGVKFDYMVGSQIEGFETMVGLSDDAKIAVFEGDEYLTSPIDRRSKFHLYHPHIAVLTGIAWDHVNVFPIFEQYVETFRVFANLIEQDGKLIYFDQDEHLRQIAASLRKDVKALPYGTHPYRIDEAHRAYLQTKEGEWKIDFFGEHNLQNVNAARLVCESLGVRDEDFYRAIRTFRGAAGRLQKIAENGETVVYKDFAHSPSKLRATVHAVRQQYRDRKIVACMELHTFSSLTESFLPQYAGCMDEADVAYVYFNPQVVTHKRLASFTDKDVRAAFGGNVRVFEDSKALAQELLTEDYRDAVLLMMSSGTFDGMDIKDLAAKIVKDE